MAAGDESIRHYLRDKFFAKTSNGYWLAWHQDHLAEIAVLPPEHPADQPCEWLHNAESIEAAITMVESGHYSSLNSWERIKQRVKPLRPELEARIKACYPHGQLQHINKEQCNFTYIGPIQKALNTQLPVLGAQLEDNHFNRWSQLERIAEGQIFDVQQPNISWPDRLKWAKQVGKTYVSCHLTLSTVFPAYDLQYCIWPPESDNVRGIFMDNYSVGVWGAINQLIADCCGQFGLYPLSKDELNQVVPFVTEGMSTDDDDADNPALDQFMNDEISELEYDRSQGQCQCHVYCCLFQGH